VRVTSFIVKHARGTPSYALRVEYAGEVVTYSGDTEWTEALVEAARGADLFICEAYFFEKQIKFYLDYQTLHAHRGRFDCRRMILTHVSRDMLIHLDEVEFECTEDGKVVIL
jgi:ribonuclease BN (tRNA processing enzyme)